MPTHSDPGTLDEISLRAGIDIRSPLLRALVDLYLQKPVHTSEEAQHFTELMLRLIDQVDAATCAAIERRLASYPSVPPAIAQRLADRLSRTASRGRAAIDAPRESVRISSAELSELFFAARSTERRLILMNIGYAVGQEPPSAGRNFPEAARELETAALARKPDVFMRALERWLGISPALARRIVTDPLGEPIVVTSKEIGIAPEAVQRILLFLNPAVGRSISRVYELATLFESIDAKAAHALISIWRAAHPQPAERASSASDQGVGWAKSSDVTFPRGHSPRKDGRERPDVARTISPTRTVRKTRAFAHPTRQNDRKPL